MLGETHQWLARFKMDPRLRGDDSMARLSLLALAKHSSFKGFTYVV
jgi:hypothetical protein